MYKVSVIMPVWNSECYLTEAVDSILYQTFSDFELIALDDGSTDKSLEILHNFAKKDSRVKVIACEHQGYSPLLNLGLSMAKGEYIARMDSDDVCLPERFEKQVGFLDNYLDYVAVGSQALRITPEGDPIGYFRVETDYDNILIEQIKGRGVIIHPSVMIRRSKLSLIGGYRSEFEPGEDFDLFLRLIEVGKITNLSDILLKYRTHFKNVTITRKHYHQFVKQKALKEAYYRRKINAQVPIILLNGSPEQEQDYRFLWMEMALSSGFYNSARKNALLGFIAQPLQASSLKRLLIGLGGKLTLSLRKRYHEFLSNRQRNLKFTNSTTYWKQRYLVGNTSGSGSYNNLAKFKADILNEFVQKNAVKTVIEHGCGDGNQLRIANYPKYLGLDISRQAIQLCEQTFSSDNSKVFKLVSDYDNEKSELALSLDVIYHLVENEVFHKYMTKLFGSAEKYVVIYSSNINENAVDQAKHVRHRKFTNWIEQYAPKWHLGEFIPNKYPFNGDYETSSFADFYIYQLKE